MNLKKNFNFQDLNFILMVKILIQNNLFTRSLLNSIRVSLVPMIIARFLFLIKDTFIQ
jgi:hypothetical protein